MVASKKKLAILLSKLKDFEKPKPKLEQYMTPSQAAADLLWAAFMDGNIKDKFVIDLGCGTGIFAIGAAILGAKKIVGIDADASALEIAQKNLEFAGEFIDNCEIELCNTQVEDINLKCDTVIMNPPFGVQAEHADRVFLDKALQTAEVVYSIHKSESMQFLSSFSRDHNFRALEIGEIELGIKRTMIHHTKESHPVKVCLWKFEKEE